MDSVNITRKHVLAGAVVLALVGLLAAMIVSLTGGQTPSDAAGLLRANHYSVMYDADGTAQPVSIQPYTSSIAVGENNDGQSEIVIVFKPDSTAIEGALKAQVQAKYPSFVITENGNAFVVSGPTSEFGTINPSDI